jgi:hypothetical protein
MAERVSFVVRKETIDYEAKIDALARELDKAKQLEVWIRKEIHLHGAYQVGLATGTAKGLEDALHIMQSRDRGRKKREPHEAI